MVTLKQQSMFRSGPQKPGHRGVFLVVVAGCFFSWGAFCQDAPPRPGDVEPAVGDVETPSTAPVTPNARTESADTSDVAPPPASEPATEPAAPPKPSGPVRRSILILDVALLDMPPGLDKALIGPISYEVSRDKSLSVLTGQDVRRLSEFEADKAFAGCTDDSCASEIADALGAELVVFSTLGMLGETYDFNMNLIDTKTAMSLARVNRATSDTNQLRDVVTEAAKELLSRYHANQRRPESEKLQSETLRDVSAAANATTASTGRWPRWASVAWVAGGLAIAAAALVTGLATDTLSPTSQNGVYDVVDFVGPAFMLGGVAVGVTTLVYNPFSVPAAGGDVPADSATEGRQ